jgi:hypothetical protein
MVWYYFPHLRAVNLELIGFFLCLIFGCCSIFWPSVVLSTSFNDVLLLDGPLLNGSYDTRTLIARDDA